jgi:hypothetical protein
MVNRLAFGRTMISYRAGNISWKSGKGGGASAATYLELETSLTPLPCHALAGSRLYCRPELRMSPLPKTMRKTGM